MSRPAPSLKELHQSLLSQLPERSISIYRLSVMTLISVIVYMVLVAVLRPASMLKDDPKDPSKKELDLGSFFCGSATWALLTIIVMVFVKYTWDY
jgi:hypothetical protein